MYDLVLTLTKGRTKMTRTLFRNLTPGLAADKFDRTRQMMVSLFGPHPKPVMKVEELMGVVWPSQVDDQASVQLEIAEQAMEGVLV